MKKIFLLLLLVVLLMVSAFQVPPPEGTGGTIFEVGLKLVALAVGALGGSSLMQLLKKLVWGESPPDNVIVDVSIQAMMIALSAVLAVVELLLLGWFSEFEFDWSMALEVSGYIYTLSQVWYSGIIKPRE